MKYFSLFILSILFTLNIIIAQSKLPITLGFTMNKKDLHKLKDFNIQIKLSTSQMGTSFPFRRCFIYQYNKDTISEYRPDIVINLEKIIKGNYFETPLSIRPYEQSGLCYDSLGFELFDTLSIKTPLVYDNNIGPLFKLRKGLYRIRVKLYLPTLDEKHPEYIYSKWHYFNVSNSVIDYSDLDKQLK